MQFFIVLVAPACPENVGAAARAMKNMGFHSLRIVDRQAHLELGARRVAHGAGDILDNVTCYPTLADALADVDFTVATTARSRARFHYYCTPTELLELMQEKQQWVGSAALVFGREDSGLTNDELALADILTGVPMQADYPSLNLGQAVMVYCYQLAQLMQVQAETAEAAQAGQLVALRHRLKKLLVTLQVDDDEKLRDWLMQRIGLLQQRDTAMLHTLLHDIEKALK
ncbi:tRNA/rRNA methyltransferase [Candidatus Symbiopectobacterium sp. 'North America']|uniref:tRNA/rRNA methyltransferase n=1 Tax=Candidatus Symbiopectobacterium sp. 'North America' TaxID=2794574 RepID=UPI0018CBE2CF|nr:tRNA/rRNA methyltransferase [Candidatus Symbiopectobacterium sp. 'North America']MBG6245896.1 tRNA/rRNA methyltransferase [Candidatus Symbiopectobacterium sp. 'North America']